jgi:aromatic ring-cleaving dioxygenase
MTAAIKRPRNLYAKYHAHVYFDEATLSHAEWLCRAAAERFGAAMGRVHRKLVGPHPHWSCQLAFDAAQFDALVRWLDENRGRLNILVHGLTGNDLEDHTTHASWLGEPSRLNLDVFTSGKAGG